MDIKKDYETPKRMFQRNAPIQETIGKGIEYVSGFKNGNKEINEKSSKLIEAMQELSSPNDIKYCLGCIEQFNNTLLKSGYYNDSTRQRNRELWTALVIYKQKNSN